MKAELPAKSVSRLSEYEDAASYRINCECMDDDHAISMWIETKEDHECQHVEVSFYVNTSTPFWSMGRWRTIWKILRHGFYCSQHSLLLDRQGAMNFAEAIKVSIENLEKKSTRKKS